MKRISLFVLMCIGAAALPAASLQSDFDRANRLYAEGRFAAALEIYERLMAAVPDWKVYYNAGNACYKLGRFLDAKIHYLRAKKMRPLSLQIAANIQVVNRNFRDKWAGEKSDFFPRLFLGVETLLGDDLLFVLLLCFSLAANLYLLLFILGKRTRPVIYGTIVPLLVFLLLFGYQQLRIQRLWARTTAVVVHENAELRSGPGTGNTVLFKVNPGLELRILERSQDWYQVSASAQIAGWIETGAIELI